MIDELCNKLAEIFFDYRVGEIEKIDSQHVRKWVSQFDKSIQVIILEEMVYVFSNWYFNRDYIVNIYLEKIIGILQKKYDFVSEQETCMNVSFMNMQSVGQSQKMLIYELKCLKKEQYGIIIPTIIDKSFSHYAYIDDGLYSGSKAKKDIEELAFQLKPGDTLDVFYLVMCTQAFSFRKKYFKKLEDDYKINIYFHNMFEICNEREISTLYENGMCINEGAKNHMCLWPNQTLKKDAEISAYYEYLKNTSDKYERRPYRYSHWSSDSGIFSNEERRSIIEYEFLKKGIDIVKEYNSEKGIYPLGYNLWPSFGFGVLFATAFNVPNNAPVVFWADKNWYPLLPRRINSNIVDRCMMEDENKNQLINTNQYSTCPDCGRFYDINEDGGNGFCVDCAWKH